PQPYRYRHAAANDAPATGTRCPNIDNRAPRLPGPTRPATVLACSTLNGPRACCANKKWAKRPSLQSTEKVSGHCLSANKKPLKRGLLKLVAGAGFEPTTFGL